MQDQFDKLMESKISSGQEKKSEVPPKKKPPRRGKRIALKLVLVLCCAVLLVCGAAVWGYTLSVNGRNLPQVYVNGVFVIYRVENAYDALAVGLGSNYGFLSQFGVVLNHGVHGGNGAVSAEINLALRRVVG